MTRQIVLDVLSRILPGDVGADDIDPHESLLNMGLTSIQLVSLILEIEGAVGRQLTQAQLRASTIGSLDGLVQAFEADVAVEPG